MPKDETLQKHTLNLYAGDMDRLQEAYPDVAAAVIIRKILRAYLNQIDIHGASSVQAEVEINI